MSAEKSGQQAGAGTGGSPDRAGGSPFDSMDTAAFIALNAAYLNGDGGTATGAGATGGTTSSATSSTSSSASATGGTRQTPAAPAHAATSAAGAGQPRGDAAGSTTSLTPINPLVAAREAGAGRTEDAEQAPAGEGLYPIADKAPTREIDTSFTQSSDHGHVIRTIVIVIAVIAVVAVGAFLVLRHQAHATMSAAISAAWGDVADADAVIGPLSSAIDTEINEGTVDAALSDAMLKSQTASNALASANDAVQVGKLTSLLASADQQQAVTAVKASVAARQQLMAIGRELLLNDTSANKALASLQDAYASIADANAQYQLSYSQSVAYESDPASVDYATVVAADTAAATDVTNAQASVAAAKESYADADYTALETYLTAAANAYGQLVTYDTAVMNGDTATADATLDAYNAALAQLQQAATALPADGMAVIRSAYADATGGSAKSYGDAVDVIGTNDAIVVSYLGANGVTARTLADASTDGMAASSADGASGSSAVSAHADAAASAHADATAASAPQEGDASSAAAPAAAPEATATAATAEAA
ncbi:hypothetical protein I3I95_08400 [bacterium]|nr:hypothetical protein [bacterium]